MTLGLLYSWPRPLAVILTPTTVGITAYDTQMMCLNALPPSSGLSAYNTRIIALAMPLVMLLRSTTVGLTTYDT